MVQTFLIVFLLASAAFLGCYLFFYRREKELLDRLLDMIEAARRGNIKQYEISEEKISVVENSFKHFLDESAMLGENQKQQKERIQGLISDISHQTMTPISNLKIYTELLKEEGNGNMALVQIIQEQTERLDFLIQSLVKLSRMENGIITVCPVRTDLSELLTVIYQEYNAKAEQKQIDFLIEPTDLKADFDLKWTCEAIGNIVDNAIKYTKSKGHVSISTQKYAMFVRIDICDDGIGIAEEEIPNIFSRFYRSFDVVDEAGVGIGLYLAREIIRAQRGYMKVSSEKGRGSTFSVFLPFA